MGPQVAEDVRALGALAAHMRRRRFASGALRLDNVKLVFRMGADGNPASAEPHGGLPGCSLCLTQRLPLKTVHVKGLLCSGFFGVDIQHLPFEQCASRDLLFSGFIMMHCVGKRADNDDIVS